MDPSRWHEGQEERCAFAAVGGRPRGDDAPGAAPWTSGSFHMGAAIGEASDGFSRGAGPFGASPFVGCGRRGARQRRRNGLGAKRGGGWQKQTAEFNVESVSAEGCSGRTGWPSASPSFSPPGQPGGSPNGVRSEFELGWDGRAESRRQSGLFALHPAPSQGPFASTPACDASGRSDASDADSGGSPLAKRPSEGRREGGGRDAGPERERPVKHMPASPRNEREQAEYKPPMDIEPPSATAMAEERGAEGRASGAADMFASTQPPSDGGRRGWFSFGFGMVPGWAVSPAVPKAPPPRMNTLAAHLGEMELGGECTAEGIDLSRNVDSVLSLGTSPVGGGLAESDAGQSAGIGSSEKEGHRCREGKGDAESKGEGNASECEEREEKRQKIRYPVDAQNRRRGGEPTRPAHGGYSPIDLRRRAFAESATPQRKESQTCGLGRQWGCGTALPGIEVQPEAGTREPTPSLTSRIYNGVYKFVFGLSEGTEPSTGPTAAGRLAGRKANYQCEGNSAAESSESPKGNTSAQSSFFFGGTNTQNGRSGFFNFTASTPAAGTCGSSASRLADEAKPWRGGIATTSQGTDQEQWQSPVFLFKGGASTTPACSDRKPSRAGSTPPGASGITRLHVRRSRPRQGCQAESPQAVPTAPFFSSMAWTPAGTPALPMEEKGDQAAQRMSFPMHAHTAQPAPWGNPMADTPMSVFPSGNPQNNGTPMSLISDETPDSIKQNPVQEAAGVPRMPVCTPFPGHVASGQQAQKTTEGTGQEGAPEPAVDPLRAWLWTPRDKKGGNSLSKASVDTSSAKPAGPSSPWSLPEVNQSSFQGAGNVAWASMNWTPSEHREHPHNQRRWLRAKKGLHQCRKAASDQKQGGTSDWASGTAESENQVLQGGEAHKKKGNALFAQGKYYQAEAEYTKALEKLECLSSSSHLAPLFCNRAAVWLMTSNPMRALEDCQRAQEADKVYARAYLRGSTCHLRLGRFAAAKETLESAKQNVPSSCSMYLDLVPKLTEVQQLESQFERVKSHLMQSELTEAGIRGGLQELEVIEKEVSHSEELWALKVLSLLRAGDRGRVVPALDCACKALDLKPPKTLWWQWVAVQAWFHDGKQEEVTRRATQLISAMEQQPGEAMPCPTGFDLRPTVTELKDVIRSEEVANRIKLEGNAAFKGQNYKKAIELYGKTLAACKHGAVSRRFLSIVLSNRAAAYQGAGAFAEAIADCCMAQTVDTTFARAQVRLARLLMQVSRPQAAVGVLQKVVDSGCATNSDHREALLRLGEAQAMVTKDPEPDHYRMLGLKADCKIEDVKKAYRQLALRLHPDKAALNIPCLSLKFGSSGVKVLGESRIRECIKEEASWLFKLVNEAHNTLTDLVNRRKLERELFEMRKGHSSVSGNASRHDSSIFGFSRNNGNTFWPSPRSGFHNQRGGFQHQRSGFPNHHGRFQNSQGHYMHRAGHAPDAFNSHAGWHSNRGF